MVYGMKNSNIYKNRLNNVIKSHPQILKWSLMGLNLLVNPRSLAK